MPPKVLVVVNKDEGFLGVSETFLHAHINNLSAEVSSLIGNPGARCIDYEKQTYLTSRRFLPLAIRWAIRKLGLATVHSQDTRALEKYLKRNRIDVVLAEYGPTAASVVDACANTGTPLIAHFHGYDAYTDYALSTYKDAYRTLFDKASAIVAVSTHMRQQLISIGAPADRVHYSSCGAELPDGVTASPGASEKKFVMLGRLTDKKAPYLSILAFAKVVERHADAQLDVIGDGPLRGVCEQLAAALGIHKNVTFHGAQPHKVALEFLIRARCFVQHSVKAINGDHEGTPVSVLEAMGLGLPVVATKHGGIMDAIESSQFGSLVDELDIDATAEAMCRYADNAELAQEIGNNARRRALESWTSEKSIERLDAIVRKVLEGQDPGAEPAYAKAL